MGKTTLILDVDGVVLDYDPLMRLILQEQNVQFTEDPGSWYRFGLDRPKALSIVSETWNDDRFGDLLPIEGFIDYHKKIKDMYNIIYCTNVREIKGKFSRLKNLLKLGIYHPVFFSGSAQEKGKFIRSLPGNKTFIDDKPLNVKSVKELSPETTCYWFNEGSTMLHTSEEHTADYVMTGWSL